MTTSIRLGYRLKLLLHSIELNDVGRCHLVDEFSESTYQSRKVV